MNNKEFESLRKQMEINDLDLHREILEQPTVFLRWAIRAARSSRNVKEIQMQTKVVAAGEIKKIKEQYFKDNGKPLPVSASPDKTDLPLCEEYKQQLQKQVEAEEELDILVAARETARQRKDMLVQLALSMREEERSNIVIRRKED